MSHNHTIGQINAIRNRIAQAIADIENLETMDLSNQIALENSLSDLEKAKDGLQTLAEELASQ